MLKIGDFSKVAQVSVKTLRYYGELGLLKPAWIDRFTGYRYYALNQLPRLNRILALKDLDFSLEQIQRLLRDDLSAAELRGMMRMKHAELERQVQAKQARLVRVETRLRQIELEGTMPEYEVVLKTVPPQRVIGIRDVIPGYRDVERLFETLRAHLQAQNFVPDVACPYIAIYYDAEYHDRGIDAEAAALLSRPFPGMPLTVVHELPGVEAMACLVHQGGYEGLSKAYNTLMAWTEANGYHVTGPNRDVYLQGPEAGLGATNYVTEVQFPVKKKPISSFIHKEQSDMEPQIVTKPAFTVVGMLYRGKNENNEIAQMWQEFMPRIGEIVHEANLGDSYGVCRDMDPEGVFEYVAGFEVDSGAAIPEGMVSWDIPAQKYAVFPCTLPTIGEAYQHAFQTWLPRSGYQRGDGPDFELYDETFDPNVQDSEMYIYIPIK
ncbi:MAG: GyrI-like domain-containing protein [Chloroflexota bacterium]|nr:GyrI-like domain-containing protein [Chloroflexota bacterium]